MSSKPVKKSDQWGRRVLPVLLSGVLAAGDTHLRDRTQEVVTAEYARVYQELLEAKQSAEKEGRKLLVLLGEKHETVQSYIHHFIFADVARRLGIVDSIHEAPIQAMLDNAVEIGDKENKKNLSILRALKKPEDTGRHPDKKAADLQSVLNTPAILPLFEMAVTEMKEANWMANFMRENDIKVPEIVHRSNIYIALGYQLHAGDPERYDPKIMDEKIAERREKGEVITREDYIEEAEIELSIPKLYSSYLKITAELGIRNRFDPVVENAMLAAVRDFPRHAIATYGANHVPFLVEHLQQSGKKILAYDISNDGEFSYYSPNETDNVERERKTTKLADEGYIKKLVFHYGDWKRSDLMSMVISAALDHRVQCREVEPEVAKTFQRILPFAVEQIAPGSAKEPRGR